MIAEIIPCAGGKPVLHAKIEPAARKFSEAHAELTTIVLELNQKIEGLKAEAMMDIKRAVARVAATHATLAEHIQANPDLFTKPRTVVMHGIKLGLQKGKGGIEIADVERTVELIHKHYGDGEEARSLLHITEKPDKDALLSLPVADLKRLGCGIIDTTDEVVIRPVDGEVDKIVRALVKEATALPE